MKLLDGSVLYTLQTEYLMVSNRLGMQEIHRCKVEKEG